jgi:spore germination protein YaaH
MPKRPSFSSSILPLFCFLLYGFSPAASREDAKSPEETSVHRSFMEEYALREVSGLDLEAGPGYDVRALERGAGISGLRKEVFGYFPYWFIDRWNLVDYQLVSTIAYFSGEAEADGSISNTHGWPRYPGDPSASANVISMINAAHGAGVKVVLCITNFDGNEIHSIVSDSTNRTTFIQQALALVQAGGGDGVNINFEGIQGASRDGVTDFMKALADTFHTRMPGSQVSCAPTDFDTRSGDWDIAAINPYVDLFFFQGYGYGYRGSSVTKPVGLLTNTPFWGSLNETTLIGFVLARIPPTKVVLGVPHFGYRWPASSPDPKASTLGQGVGFYYPDALGFIDTYGRLWDGLALNPWYRYESSGTWYQGWYDGPESMSYKYQFVWSRDLMGVGMWSLGMDGSNHDIWDVTALYFADSTYAGLPPRAPTLSVLKDSSSGSEGRALISWTATADSNLGGFRLFSSGDPFTFSAPPIADETTLDSAARSFLVEGLTLNTTYYFKMVAVDTLGTLASDTSDTYGVRTGPGVRYLIVDGFDRVTGSWNLPQHAFNAFYAEPLEMNQRWFDAADNDAVIEGSIDLNDYPGVIWFLGDESVSDRTFDGTEQQLVGEYLGQGGALYVTGSEIGFDLGRSASPNYSLAWYNSYLKANYTGDDAGTTTFYGTAGSIFEGLNGQFGQTYPEDWPDYVTPVGASASALNYNASRIAGVQYSGTFGNGFLPGHLVYVAFAVETIASAVTRSDMMGRIIQFFEGTTSAGTPEELPEVFSLSQNFPNPFNPSTTIRFSVPAKAPVRLTVIDMLGREVATLVDEELEPGTHTVQFNAQSVAVASGTYLYRLTSGDLHLVKKMILVK